MATRNRRNRRRTEAAPDAESPVEAREPRRGWWQHTDGAN